MAGNGYNIAILIQSSLREWVGGCNIAHGHGQQQRGRASCLANTFQLVMKDDLGLGSRSAIGDAAPFEMWSLHKNCQWPATHFSWSIKSACLLQERQGEGGEKLHPCHECMLGGAEECRTGCHLLHDHSAQGGGAIPSPMVRVLKSFQDTIKVLSVHSASRGQVIPLILELDPTQTSAVEPSHGREGASVHQHQVASSLPQRGAQAGLYRDPQIKCSISEGPGLAGRG